VSSGREAVTSTCVFCGANEGTLPAYVSATRDLGRALAREGIRIVYGGAAIGLMGALADAALEAGGGVVGVVPSRFPDGVVHQGLTELHVVPGMHERKALMAQLSQAYVVLPGGLGTIDEMFEALTWAQLGLHRKPLAILDVGGYFAPILEFLQRAHDQRFLLRPVSEVLSVATDVDGILACLRNGSRMVESPPRAAFGPAKEPATGPATENGRAGS